MEKITKASVISRAAVADKSMAKKRFDGLVKQHLPGMVYRRKTKLFGDRASSHE